MPCEWSGDRHNQLSAFDFTVFAVLQGVLSMLFSELLQGRYSSSKGQRWKDELWSKLVNFFLNIIPLPCRASVILGHLPQLTIRLIIPSFVTLALHLVVPYLVMLLLWMSFWLILSYHPIGTKMSPPKRDCLTKYYLSVLFCKYAVYFPHCPFPNL